jgi:uncharacterized damage-inducible protein DinB
MEFRQSIQRLFIFDLWCSRRLTDYIREKGKFREYETCVSLLSHIINAQQIWFDRVLGIDLNDTAPWDDIDMGLIKSEAGEIHKRWIDLIGDHDLDLDSRIVYQNSGGVTCINSITVICNHIILHGQHHRAQISLLLSRSGISPPSIDYIHYLREKM